MTIFRTIATAALAAAALSAAAPATAVVTAFATFSALDSTKNFVFLNSGNLTSASRTTDAKLFTTATGTSTTPGSIIAKFSFLQPALKPYVDNYSAKFTYTATIARGTPAVGAFGGLVQQGITGNFSFLTTTAITVSGPSFITHTYAIGSNLLSGTFSKSTLFGSGSSASTSSSTSGGSMVTFTSDFLDFSSTIDRGRSLTLDAITPTLAGHTGLNKALNTFRTTVGGQFSSDPAPVINGLVLVPEPATWSLFVVGFGLVGCQVRRRARSTVINA